MTGRVRVDIGSGCLFGYPGTPDKDGMREYTCKNMMTSVCHTVVDSMINKETSNSREIEQRGEINSYIQDIESKWKLKCNTGNYVQDEYLDWGRSSFPFLYGKINQGNLTLPEHTLLAILHLDVE